MAVAVAVAAVCAQRSLTRDVRVLRSTAWHSSKVSRKEER